MEQLSLGGRVRIDIPDEDDPDFQWHGEHGVIVDIIEDDTELATGDDRDSVVYRVVLDDHDITIDARWRDLRPPFDEEESE